jgi:hypothetical protein
MLNLSSNGGSGNYIRFSPQANAWTNNLGEEIQLKKVVFDINDVQTGWLELGVGVRNWQPDAALGKKGPQPSPESRRGFIVKFYNKEVGLVEWSSNGVGSNMSLEKLYLDCAAQQAANVGKLPVLEYTGSKLEKIGKGTTRIPAFNIISWIDRPLGMDAVGADHSVPAAVPVYTPRPSFLPPVAAPAPTKTVMAAAVADDEMF